MPRIVHRVTEIFASEHQSEPILIPCAGQAQPQAKYHWFWIPFSALPGGEQLDVSWDNELADLVASIAGNSGGGGGGGSSMLTKLAVPIKPSGGGGGGGGDDLGLGTSRLRNLGSTLVIQGPISQSNSGYYIGIVSNTIGYDRCLTTVYVRSLLKLRLEVVKETPNAELDYRTTASMSTTATIANRTIVRVVRGQSARLRCSVSGFPVSSVYWLHNTMPVLLNDKTNSANSVSSSSYLMMFGQQQQPPPQQSSSPDRFSMGTLLPPPPTMVRELVLRMDEQKQSGMYQCFARNRFETSQASVELMVIGKCPPLTCSQMTSINHSAQTVFTIT